jgi:hypothetical protein
MATRIVFNGKVYADAADMPPDVRALYDQAMSMLVDADRNGIPDVLERAGVGNVISVQETRLIVNGKEYGGADEMPADVRRLYETAISQAGGLGVGAGRTSLPEVARAPAEAGGLQGFDWRGVLRFALLAAVGAALVIWLL